MKTKLKLNSPLWKRELWSNAVGFSSTTTKNWLFANLDCFRTSTSSGCGFVIKDTWYFKLQPWELLLVLQSVVASFRTSAYCFNLKCSEVCLYCNWTEQKIRFAVVLSVSSSVHPFIPDSVFNGDHVVICFQCYSHAEMGHVPPTAICLCYRADTGEGLWSLCTLLFSFPSLHPLVIWCPDGAVTGEGSLSCGPSFLTKN